MSGSVWSIKVREQSLVLCCLGHQLLGTMSHSPESQEPVGFGTGLVQVLAKQVNCFHAQSDVAHH